MYECLLEIGFEADAINTKENPELMEMAKEICNEYPDTRGEAIAEFRKMIFDRDECRPYRTDDEFLLRFLRVRKFIVPRAHRLLVRYCAFREQNKHLYEGIDLWSMMKLKDVYSGTMTDHPDHGRLGILRFGMWDPNDFPIDDVVRGGFLIFEIGVRQPKLQIFGSTIIIDLEGITVRQIAALTPTIAYQIVCLLGTATPGRNRGIHVINYSWILNSFFYLFKRFIPQEAWGLIHFHGNDLKSLQQHIGPEFLPPRYGGTCRCSANIAVWLKKIKKYRDEQFDRDMKQLGYDIKE